LRSDLWKLLNSLAPPWPILWPMPSREIEALLDAAVDAVVMIDHRGTISVFNRSAERLFGYSAEEIVGQNVKMLMPPSWRAEHDGYLDRYARTGIPHIIGVGREVEGQRKDGSRFPAFLSVGRVADSDPPRFVGFVRDVTTERLALASIQAERDQAVIRRREEQEARRLQERLTNVSRMATMGEMAAGIAHELNQPLSAIATYARACERFLNSSQPDLPETLSALEEISLEAMRAGDMIRRLRQLVSNQPSAQEPTEINELVRDLSVLMQADARVHRTLIEFELAPTLPRVRADRAQLQQMVLSLVRNAVEALADASTTGRKIVISTARMPDGRVELSVCDNGPGVSADMVDRLFMPFVTTRSSGTGLGLAISQTIAQAHGATLAYRANEPAGACFYTRFIPAENPA
jgi:two-component system, LuxR family, sensor kinase FixL